MHYVALAPTATTTKLILGIQEHQLSINTVQGEIPTDPENLTLSGMGDLNISGAITPPSYKFISEVKKDVKAKVLVSENDYTFDHVSTLIKQGNFLKLTYIEKTDATWKSFIYNLPKGTMKWVLNSSLDTLPTKVNLKQWGKVSNDKCFCGTRQTLNHILNCCKKSLNDGRFTFRHDNILNYISKCLDLEKFKCYIDLEGFKTPAGGTLPPSLVVSNLKPDIVVLDRKNKTVDIFELTCPGETRIDIAHKLKQEKYQHFEKDISSYKASVIPFEIGSNTGFISTRNKASLNKLHTYCKKNIKLKQFNHNISAVTILSSYFIFNCRNQPDWESMDHIQAPFPNQ